MAISISRVQNLANYLIQSFVEKGEPIGNLKLQKLLYYTQGWSLAILGETFFENDLEARMNGPVCPEIYHNFKGRGYMSITNVGKCDINMFTEKQDNLLTEVLQVYGGLTAGQLVAMTHRESPWVDARGELEETQPSNIVIEKDSMRDFFLSKLED